MHIVFMFEWSHMPLSGGEVFSEIIELYYRVNWILEIADGVNKACLRYRAKDKENVGVDIHQLAQTAIFMKCEYSRFERWLTRFGKNDWRCYELDKAEW